MSYTNFKNLLYMGNYSIDIPSCRCKKLFHFCVLLSWITKKGPCVFNLKRFAKEHRVIWLVYVHFSVVRRITCNQLELSNSSLFPNADVNTSCTVMLLYNLAETEWVQTHCLHEIFTPFIICQNLKFNINTTAAAIVLDKPHLERSCSADQILNRNLCFTFQWFTKHHKTVPNQYLLSSLRKEQSVLVTKNIISSVLDTISANFPPFLFVSSMERTKVFKVASKRHLSIHHYKNTTISITNAQGFFLKKTMMFKIIAGENTAECDSKGFASLQAVFHGESKCSITTDRRHDIKQEGNCSLLMYKTQTGSCVLYLNWNSFSLSLQHSVDEQNKPYLTCKHGQKLHLELVDDLVADCGPAGEDEKLLVSLLISFKQLKVCQHPYELPCWEGHTRCFNTTDICKFSLNRFGFLVPCRNGAHLEHCTHYACHAKYKCTNSYCIPFSYLCDGKWDCPEGDDEPTSCRSNQICSYQFKCKRTANRCLHLGDVCDSVMDCPHADDEDMCELSHITCPTGCGCLAFAIICPGVSNVFASATSYPHVYFSFQNITDMQFIVLQQTAAKALFLSLYQCNLSFTDNDIYPHDLLLINVSLSSLKTLFKSHLSPLLSLKILSITDNEITSIESFAFTSNLNLTLLVLSQNPLTHLPDKIFSDKTCVKAIYVVNVPLIVVSLDVFSITNLKVLNTNSYHLCCTVLPSTKCTETLPWYFSCQPLLLNSPLKINFITISVVIVVFNVFAVCLNVGTRKHGKIFSMIASAVSMNNFLFSVYLGFVWGADINFKENFSSKEEMWRSGFPCYFAHFTFLAHLLHSQLNTILLSLSRLRVVASPMKSKFKKFSYVRNLICLATLVSIMLAFFVTIIVYFAVEILSSNFCMPLVDPSDESVTIKIITSVVATSLIAAPIVVIILHFQLALEFQKTAKNLPQQKPPQTPRLTVFLIVQLVLLTFVHILSCFTTSAICVTLMILSRYPVQLVPWTIVAVMPIKSLVDPCVFLFIDFRNMCKEK